MGMRKRIQNSFLRNYVQENSLYNKVNGYIKVKCETHYIRVSATACIVNYRYLSEENSCIFTVDIMSYYVISSF